MLLERTERFNQVIRKIDQVNGTDPNVEVVDGQPFPRELVYSQRLTGWVLTLKPDASEALRIAARGQHIGRWKIPRDRYPKNRGGYLRWRDALKALHADQVAVLMRETGYPEETIQHVQAIILKKDMKHNANTQTLEDALCLVFLETQFKDLMGQTEQAKMAEIIRKTWKKMSAQGHAHALQLPLGLEERDCIKRALALGQDGLQA